ncbi:hypothetical protein [Campylobacter sp.]|uniref:hypothetical protein n=1 Tax=Campylobacter sp. TaxID=205 RepID=UPI0026DC3A99|nr:hypothetical protein [Campylobacter sp.]MDO4674523.1 hypothetical protein [Campylobacter sp.]
MKRMILMLLPFFLSAQNLELEGLRTELYSKSGGNVLKKIELGLEFEGKNVKDNEKKIIDAVHTVLSGFFYEDIFTELGKNNFKKTLEKFLDKKYKIKIDSIYILSLSGVEKFDLEELKRFLQGIETKPAPAQTTAQTQKFASSGADSNRTLKIPPILPPMSDEGPEDDGAIDPKLFELSRKIERVIKEGNLTNPSEGFAVEFEGNQSQP